MSEFLQDVHSDWMLFAAVQDVANGPERPPHPCVWAAAIGVRPVTTAFAGRGGSTQSGHRGGFQCALQ